MLPADLEIKIPVNKDRPACKWSVAKADLETPLDLMAKE